MDEKNFQEIIALKAAVDFLEQGDGSGIDALKALKRRGWDLAWFWGDELHWKKVNRDQRDLGEYERIKGRIDSGDLDVDGVLKAGTG